MNFIDTLAQILPQVWYLLPLFMLLTIFKVFIDKKEKELKKEKRKKQQKDFYKKNEENGKEFEKLSGKKFEEHELTLDHVYPKSRFGPDIWENIVTCCKECNQFKADKTPKEAGMKLLRRPYRPKEYFVYEMKKYSFYEQQYWKKWAS